MYEYKICLPLWINLVGINYCFCEIRICVHREQKFALKKRCRSLKKIGNHWCRPYKIKL
jgi:hypothetical protein